MCTVLEMALPLNGENENHAVFNAGYNKGIGSNDAILGLPVKFLPTLFSSIRLT